MILARFVQLSAVALASATLNAANNPASEGLNSFAISSYSALAKGNGNLILSPLSIGTALSMALNGARGLTAAEMIKVTHQNSSSSTFASLVDEITNGANIDGDILLAANGLWMQRDFPIQPAFSQILLTAYHAPPTQLDFLKGAEQGRAEINRWTSQHTNGKITELFAPGSLDAKTRLVLTSAIYFNGKWQNAFREKDTSKAPFKLESGGEVQTNFMSQTASFDYGETPTMQILEMKYAGGLAFDILLPKSGTRLADLEKSLDAKTLSAWFASMQNRTVEVKVPKFRSDSEFSLRDSLSRMGMPTAFNGFNADFSGIDGRRELALSEVVHKAFVDVSEEGTEAAAATGISITRVAAIAGQRPVFRADHPFTFFIRDTKTGVIVFAGRLIDPVH